MIYEQFTTEQLIDRWEDQRDIKNLMGIFANYLILNRDGDIFTDLWSKEQEDVCLGFNDGWYVGREAVGGYYRYAGERHALVSELLQKKFPKELGDKSAEDIYGIGTFRVNPIVSPIVKVAGDGKTAKGLWYSQGAHAELSSGGPTSFWCFGYFAADFIREGDSWKLWHVQHTNDVDSRCGSSWGKPIEPLQELPEFAALKDFPAPAYSVSTCLREYYSPSRPLTGAPRLPEEYETFADTFSYGI